MRTKQSCSPRSTPSTTIDRHRIERGIEMYLRACYREHTAARVSELADFFGTHRAHLSRLVVAVLGEPLGDVLRRRQLAYAERLLREAPHLTVAEIAAHAAFGTERTFFRAFRKTYSTTPAAYRENATK